MSSYPPNIMCGCGVLVHVDMPNVIADENGDLWHDEDDYAHPVGRYALSHEMDDQLLLGPCVGCPNNSPSGDEGPISEPGRMPERWRCDECGAVVFS
jgi:hypothetical protein